MLRRHLMLSFLLLLACPISPAPATAAPPQKWAVLVGVDKYRRPDVTPLRCAVADVRAVAKVLQARCGFPKDNVFLLTSDQGGDGAPTRGNLAFRLGWLDEHVQPGDTVIFFFSGHGIQMGESSYLLTCDADPRNASTLRLTGYRRETLQNQLRGLRAKALLMVLDACRSDPRAGKGVGEGNKLTSQMARDLVLERPQSKGFTATMLACSEGQRSYEWADRGHGFFTWYFLRGLNGAAADGAGRVTLKRMQAYLEKKVPAASERVTGHRQVPFIVAYGNADTPVNPADCVLAVVKPGKKMVLDVTPLSGPEPAPGAEPAPPIHQQTVRPPVPGRKWWVGTWRTDFPVNELDQFFERDNRPDGSYTDYWLYKGLRLEVRRGMYEHIGNANLRWSVLLSTKLDSLHQQGHDQLATYQLIDPNTMVIHYSSGGELTWTRVR